MELNTILNICIAHKLTFDEFFLIYMTFLARDEEKHPEYLERWINNNAQERLRDLFDSLKQKGIIHKDYSPDGYDPNDIEFNQTFVKMFLKESCKMGQDLFAEYPSFLTINGKTMSLKNISKKFYNLDDFYFYYSSAIGHNPNTHKEVMELVRWAKDKNLITFGILEFIASQKWTMLKEMRENNVEDNFVDSIYLD